MSWCSIGANSRFKICLSTNTFFGFWTLKAGGVIVVVVVVVVVVVIGVCARPALGAAASLCFFLALIAFVFVSLKFISSR